MNELHLFAGAGGGILGGILLGHTTVCAVEIDPYRRKVLLQRQRDGILPRFPIWDDVRTFDGKPWRGFVDIVCGGFPCQDISCAGKGAGISGERSGLWVEMARIICEVKPRYVLVENSPMLTIRGLGTVLRDLAAMGYDAKWGVLGAVHAGAPHKRLRIWIVANAPCAIDRRSHTESGERQIQQSGIGSRAADVADATQRQDDGRERRDMDGQEESREGSNPAADTGRKDVADAERISFRPGLCPDESGRIRRGRSRDGCCAGEVSDTNKFNGDGSGFHTGEVSQLETANISRCEELSNTNGNGLERPQHKEPREGTPGIGRRFANTDWWLTEPDVGRVANGVASRVDRLAAIGDGQVPAVVALAWRILT
ncbi:MAG: DNA cytosine methyltransferase [Syntrophales bacterium]